MENDTFEAVGSWCCMAGTVTAILRLDRKGYVLKEAIPVWAEIKNLSARRIAHTMVSLVQVGHSHLCLSVPSSLSVCPYVYLFPPPPPPPPPFPASLCVCVCLVVTGLVVS